jgi:hypothetical protein
MAAQHHTAQRPALPCLHGVAEDFVAALGSTPRRFPAPRTPGTG